MKRVAVHLGLWGGLYLTVALLLPAATAVPPLPMGRGFWVELGVGLGIIGFSLLALQFITTARFRRIASFFGSDAMLTFHRQMGILTTCIVLAHPLVLFIAKPEYLRYFDPRVNWPRAAALGAATLAIVLLVILSLWREKFGLPYEWWRITHAALSAFIIVIGVVHALQVGHYVDGTGKRVGWILAAAAAIALLAYVRLVKPWKARGAPYRVAEVRPRRGEVYTLVLEPDGHAGMKFVAGQFAWLTLGDSPITLQQHPFTFSSSACAPDRLEFAIKELGDFTSTIKDVRVGTRAFLEGPYGNFTLDDNARGGVFIVGGIGVTPAISILRTLRDRRDRRPLRLIYGNPAWDEVPFRDELDELEKELNLKVIHVLEEPPPEWGGDAGFITDELIARHITELEESDVHYFVCGPGPMMDVAERALRTLGVPSWRLLSERFDII